MRAVMLDKIASVTLNCHLRRDVRVSDEFLCKEGDVLAVRVLNAKAQYNSLELTTGRMSALQPGDVIAGALGHRNALQGYAGVIPNSLQVGGTINILNLGGVLGRCTSSSPIVGEPFECEVLGQVLDFPYLASRRGVPANISTGCATLESSSVATGAPVIAVVGTCMNSGKTEACIALIQQLVRRGKIVMAAKATGVSLRRDILAMDDAGAAKSLIFTDLGIVTTSRQNSPSIATTMLNRLAESSPDIIVLELGDGMIGEYGVDAILAEPALRSAFSQVLLAANDPVGAWGGVQILRDRYGLTPAVVTGPATDNLAGTTLIERETGVVGINARTSADRLTETILRNLEAAVAN